MSKAVQRRRAQQRQLCATILGLVNEEVAVRYRWTPGSVLARDVHGEPVQKSRREPVAWSLLGTIDKVCRLDPRRPNISTGRTVPMKQARSLLIEAAKRRGWEETRPGTPSKAVWAAEQEGGWEEAKAIAADALALALAKVETT